MTTSYFICYECGYIFEVEAGKPVVEAVQECPACGGIKTTPYSVILNGDDPDFGDGCGTPAGFT